jgi:hypothetical protein
MVLRESQRARRWRDQTVTRLSQGSDAHRPNLFQNVLIVIIIVINQDTGSNTSPYSTSPSLQKVLTRVSGRQIKSNMTLPDPGHDNTGRRRTGAHWQPLQG